MALEVKVKKPIKITKLLPDRTLYLKAKINLWLLFEAYELPEGEPKSKCG